MPVLVTGGSGFVGGDLVRSLVESGITVRATARSSTSARRVAGLGAEPIRVNLFDRDAMAAAMLGCETVFHVAGVNTMCPSDPSTLYEVNVNGPRAVVRAAAAARVPRVVLTSSAAVIGEPKGTVGDETTVHSGRSLSHYARSKHLGEQAFFDEAERFDVEGVAVNPSSVQGPGRVTGSARLFLYALTARRPVALDTVISLVDIRDVSRGHRLAAERGGSGRRYLLNGATITVREAFALLAQVTGRDVHPLMVPPAAVNAARPLVWLADLMTVNPAVCSEMLRTLLHGHRFDGGRARRELGLSYTPVSETLSRTVAWYRAHGLVPA